MHTHRKVIELTMVQLQNGVLCINKHEKGLFRIYCSVIKAKKLSIVCQARRKYKRIYMHLLICGKDT